MLYLFHLFLIYFEEEKKNLSLIFPQLSHWICALVNSSGFMMALKISRLCRKFLESTHFIYKTEILQRHLSAKMTGKTKVQVKQGIVVGQQKSLPCGKSFNYFLGIPYAIPPLGPLRFKSPIALERFSQQELDCSKERDVSHQRDPFTSEIVGSEDCLYLNVYVPQNDNYKLPVMVWIHGGGFFFGNGNSDYYFPQLLVQEDVIVVTMNYRLGALGFLCLPEEKIYGNAGLKDQRLALTWVKDNISHFNGDPDNITIFGESAGAASVHMHMYASHAKSVFHKAIMQSGTANMEWVFQTNPVFKVRQLAKHLNCTATNSKDILAFLQSDEVTPEMLLAQTLKVLTPEERRYSLPLPFKPVIEDISSPDSFITTSIVEKLQEENAIEIPAIMGYNSGEGIVMVFNAMRKLELYEKDLARCIPRNLLLNSPSSIENHITKQMRDFYFKGEVINESLLSELSCLLGDYFFTFDMQFAAEYHSRYQHKSPLYFYQFNYVGRHNMYKKIFQLEHLKGACHGDELFYLFQSLENETPLEVKDALFAKKLCKMWANFAKYGNPTPNIDDTIDCKWTPVQKISKDNKSFVLDYLEIDKKCIMLQDPDSDRVKFWRHIYDTYDSIDYSKISSKL